MFDVLEDKAVSPDGSAISDPLRTPLERPRSEVGDAVGLVGAVSLLLCVVFAWFFHLTSLVATALFLAGAAIPMVIWCLVVEKTHARGTTGLDLALRRPVAEVLAITRVKTIGLGATFALIAVAYFTFRTYAQPQYAFYLSAAALIAPLVWLISPLYIGWTTRRMIEPLDELWHFGKFVSLDFEAVDPQKVRSHVLAWIIKSFFLAFLMAGLPGIVKTTLELGVPTNVRGMISAIVKTCFLFDVTFGAIGYVLTFRVLDSHIRSVNPLVSGWWAALICYPPFVLMVKGGPLDYRSAQDWTIWLADYPAVQFVWGGAIVALILIYVWATIVFGVRFSNLTHRGIITTGPYRFFKHPAYLSKNLSWWMVSMPFLSSDGAADALRNSLLLLSVNAIYYARAKTEEGHLMADPLYRSYNAWVERNGVLGRLSAWVENRVVAS